jgi:hypothetical protein
METTATQPQQTLDVTGLPDETIRALESLVTALRGQGLARATYPSHEEWSRAFQEWVQSHLALESIADDSRESIYSGRGE